LGKPNPNQSRLIAYELVSQVNRDGAYANIRLPELLAKSKMDKADKAFTTELAYGTLRMQGRHDYIATKFVDRKFSEVDPKIQDLLRIGIHQITQMRVADHAAVSETVEAIIENVIIEIIPVEPNMAKCCSNRLHPFEASRVEP